MAAVAAAQRLFLRLIHAFLLLHALPSPIRRVVPRMKRKAISEFPATQIERAQRSQCRGSSTLRPSVPPSIRFSLEYLRNNLPLLLPRDRLVNILFRSERMLVRCSGVASSVRRSRYARVSLC